MYECPAGHPSSVADYCDECGRPIEETEFPAPDDDGLPTVPPAAVVAAEGDVWCPDCRSPNPPGSVFCEICGGGPIPPGPGRPSPIPKPIPNPIPTPIPGSVPPPPPPPPSGKGPWTVTVTADHAYFQRVLDWDGPDANTMQFPPEHPPWVLELKGERVRIGRRTPSATSAPPEIALADPGVSRRHAVLLPCPDGSWELIDTGSANGTRLNGGAERVGRADPIRVADGDRIHVGAWTTLEIRRKGG